MLLLQRQAFDHTGVNPRKRTRSESRALLIVGAPDEQGQEGAS